MPTVTALVPAHNEAAQIGATIASLRAQTRPPERIVVVADNCTDATVAIAAAAGVEVFETAANTDKKAGALNQVLAALLPGLDPADAVLVMDADTGLGPAFIEVALSRLGAAVGAVGGSFYAREEHTWLQVMQGNEYARYVREIARRKQARANVLTGAGSLFRVDVLTQVRDRRLAGMLPGAGVYKQDALTEDNELTLAIKTLGYTVVSPRACSIYTDAPATWSELFHQRVRWRRGAMEDLAAYGLTATTAPYIAKMAWSVLVSLLGLAYLWLLASIALGGGSLTTVHPFWAAVFAIYLADRWWTVRERGLRACALALFAPAEMVYDAFQQAVLARALIDFVRRAEQRWVHAPSILREEV